MSPGETRLLEFIVIRLDSMLQRPEAWGSLQSVEEQILQLLEMRRALLDPSVSPTDTRPFMVRYERFLSRVLKGATPEPLAAQLAARGRQPEFTRLMREFVEEDLALFVADAHSPAASAAPQQVEAARVIIEMMRMEAELNARAEAAQVPATPVHFPEDKN